MNNNDIRKMQKFAYEMDIAKNPEPEALYDPLTMGFNIWATQADHPTSENWEKVVEFMDQGAYAKKCAFVATAVYFSIAGEMQLSTDTYIFKDHLGMSYKDIHNRAEDIKWAKEKVEWFFRQIEIPCPIIVVVKE